MKTKITLLVLTALLGLTNVFANSMPSSENVVENEIMTTSDNSIIISAGKRIYTLDMNTYQATLLATSPYVNEINSIASDATTGWIFYVSNHISSYNWTIYGYNVYTNTHKNFGSVRHFFTSTGHAYSSRGLASGGATFYNGKLYFAMEYPTYCYYYRGNTSGNSNPKDELSNNTRAAGTVPTGMFANGPVTRSTTATEADEVDNGGREGDGETPADFEIVEAEEANQLNDNVNDYIPEAELPEEETAGNNDGDLQQRGATQAETYTQSYSHSTYNNKMYLLEISFNGLSDTSGQTTSVANGTPVYDNWWYSSFLYRGELGDIVVDDNGQMYAATSYQVQAYNFNSNRYDWANNEDVYAQMAKDKHSNLQLLKNKRTYSTYYYYGCPQNSYVTKSFVQTYTAPSSLRTYNNLQLGSLNEISGLDPHDVGRITDASDYINLTPPVSYKVKGTVYDDNNENGNLESTDGRLQGVLVTLYADNNADGVLDSGDTVIDTRNTSSTGWYAFPDVQVANTLVAVTVPSNTNTTTYTSTTPETVSITGSTDDVRVNFGINEALIPVNYDVFGTVYDDNNENGALENGEAGLGNVTLTLYNDTNADGVLDTNDTLIATTTSATDGTYSFLHVCVQNTIVAVTVPTNSGTFTYTLTTPGTQAINEINNDVTGVDFGVNEEEVVSYAISGNVYDDNDESGAQDAGEDNLDAITVTLYADNNNDGAVDAGDTVIGTATSAVDGTYSFANVTVPNTVVAVTVPANTGDFTYTLTTAGAINTSSTTTDVNGANFGINEVQIINYNISGTVFDDNNTNEVNDAEAGLDAVTLTLYADNNADGAVDGGDTVITSTTSANDGTYSFSNVTLQNTVVEVTVPTDTATFTYTLTTAGAVNTSSTTADVLGVDFGINEEEVINYNISGTVFDDNNASGVREMGEGFIGSVLITLYADNNNDGVLDAGDTVITTTTTNTMTGNYGFTGVTVQNTIVAVTVPGDTATFTYTLTTAGDQAVSSVNTNVTDVDFGIDRIQVVNYNISGTVFDDDNTNGVNDFEAGLDAVTLTLYADNNGDGAVDTGDTVITTTTSANDGTYSFSNVTAQNTLVEVTVPTNDSNFTYTLTTAGIVDTSSTVTDITGADFGINQESATYAVTGNVFNDQNGDGDITGDGGLAGVTVRLFNDINGNGRVDRGEPLISTTASDRNGNYQFTGLSAANVIVQVLVPSNNSQFQYTATTPISVALSAGMNTSNINFGIQRTIVVSFNISGIVWDDQNSDQIKDSSESRLEGVGVSLYNDTNANGIVDAGETPVSTIFSASTGFFEFTNVNFANAIVVTEVPSNGTLTTPGARIVSSVNTNIVDIDFGINIAASLFEVTGVVFDDDNENGIADPGEGSLDGLDVEIYADTDLSGTFDPNVDALVAFTQTSNGGFGFLDPNYFVNQVPPGLVFVVIVIPADNPPFESWRATYDPDTGTANPDGVYPTIMTGNIIGVNFGINYENLNNTSRDQNTDDVMFTNETSVNEAPVDVSERLRLYPNPTVRQIAINADEFAGDVTVEIYNDRGYKVMKTTAGQVAGEIKIDVARLAPGMYYAKFASNNKVASKKFIKR